MRRWITSWIMCLVLIAPVLADDEEDAPKNRSATSKSRARDEKPVDKDGEKKAKVGSSEVKKLIEVKLDPYLVPARQLNLPLPGRTREVRDLLNRLDKWAKDDDVGAILLNLDGLVLSLADIQELQAGVLEFRKAGKKVVAYLNSGDPMSYLLACAAEEIAMAPTGDLAIPGLGNLFPFMRGYYQLQGTEFDVITAGRFKYPGFINQREPNRSFIEEFNEILNSWYGDYVGMIAAGRKLSPRKVQQAIDIAIFDAPGAKSRGLIDVIAYHEEYRERVVKRTRLRRVDADESDLSRITSLQDLLTAVSKRVKEAQESYKEVGPKIAVLHARGPIVDVDLGPAWSSSIIMRDQLVKTIEEIRKNRTIRGVVLAIDSPGGSGYASDVIWRKLRELDEEKPLVVTMGRVAGSGGYYIACPGRLIFAEPTTITGSIGVLAILANQASMLNRADVNVAEMKRGARALFGAGHRDMRPEDRAFLQKLILDFYEIFLDRVSVCRKMPKDEVRKIAEGRIYTGRQALQIGLIDRLGGLREAVAAVREMANIPPSAEIKLVHYPRPSSIGELLEGMMGLSAATDVMDMVNRPAAGVSFDSQVQFFAQRPRPLCWLAIPEIGDLLRGPAERSGQIDLLQLAGPQPTPVPLR